MTTFYVSRSGNDSAAGTSPSTAFATPGRAAAAMGAKSTADITYVMDGVYDVRSPIALAAKHSNDTIAAYPDHAPIIRGGVNVANWTKAAGGVWTAKLPSISDVEQFVVNGVRQVEARYPNYTASDPIKGGWLWARDVPAGHDATLEMAYNKNNFPAGPPKAGEKVTVFSSLGYSSDVLTIKSVNTSSGIINFTEAASYDIGAGSRYFISGSKPLLDRAGEWSFDKSTHILSYKAPPSFDGTKAVASGATSLLTISNAANVTIKGLTFSDAGTDAYSDGINTAAIKVTDGNHITLNGNRFVNVAIGVSLQDDSHHVTVAGNNFKHIWSSAIEIGSGTYSNTIINNRISNSGEVFRTHGAVQMDETWGNTISSNLISDVPRFGIAEINWSPSGRSGGNIIQYNTILRSGQQTPDTGAIYIYSGDDPGALGDTIRYNRIIDAGGLGTNDAGFMNGRYMSAGIYLDDLASNAKIYGNFVQSTWFGGVYLHGGNNNDVWGNILVGNTEVGVQLNPVDGRSMAANKVHGNIISLPTHAGENVVDLDPGLVSPRNFYSNIFVGSAAQAMVGENSLARWQQMGGDKGSTAVPNPGFVNAPAGDYSLKPGSYALNRGFADLPWAKMAPIPGGKAAAQPAPDDLAPSPAEPTSNSISTDDGTGKAAVEPSREKQSNILMDDPRQEKISFAGLFDTPSKVDELTESGTIGNRALHDRFSDLYGIEFSSFAFHEGFADPHGSDRAIHNQMSGDVADHKGDLDIVGITAFANASQPFDVSHNDFYLI